MAKFYAKFSNFYRTQIIKLLLEELKLRKNKKFGCFPVSKFSMKFVCIYQSTYHLFHTQDLGQVSRVFLDQRLPVAHLVLGLELCATLARSLLQKRHFNNTRYKSKIYSFSDFIYFIKKLGSNLFHTTQNDFFE